MPTTAWLRGYPCCWVSSSFADPALAADWAPTRALPWWPLVAWDGWKSLLKSKALAMTSVASGVFLLGLFGCVL